jgi:hypothetical protein
MMFEPLEKPKEQSKKALASDKIKQKNKQYTAKLCDN